MIKRFFLAMALLLAGAGGAAATTLTITPSANPVTVGDNLTLTVHGAVSDLLTLILNPDIDIAHLQLRSFLAGSALPGASDPNNTLVTDAATANPSLFFSGSASTTGSDVTIASLTFQAIAAGTASISFSDAPLTTLNPSCDPSTLNSCYEHDAGGDPTPISGAVTFTIESGTTTPMPEPGSVLLLVGVLGVLVISAQKVRLRG